MASAAEWPPTTQPGHRDGSETASYIDAALGGRIVPSLKVRTLCAIMRKRMVEGHKQWRYDPEAAARPCNFIERFCCNPQGKPGRKIVLQPFQLFFLELVFGFVDADGLREFTELMVVMGRKNGKTTLSAGLGLYMLMADHEGAPQCYSAATSKDQASLLYGAMLNMVRQSPELSKRLHKGIIPDRAQDGLMNQRNGGYFTPLSSQTRNLDGLNVHFAVVDEMAAITNRDTYDLVKQGTSSRDQPLIVEITTNGFERDNLFDQQYDYAARWLDGEVDDDRFLPVIYELDSRDEWTSEAAWPKANPGLGTIKKVETLRGFYEKAKQDPSFYPTFMTKDMNMPENRASAWLRFDEAVNRERFDWREMGFRYCVVGYDASDSIDLTAAVALMMRPGDDHLYEMAHYWIPEESLRRQANSGYRKERDVVPYQQWAADGLLTLVPGNKIDHRVVFGWMNELRDVCDIWPFAMGYDPWHLTDDSWLDLARSFVGTDRLEPVRQGAKTLSAPMKSIRADFAAHRFVDNDNPLTEWCRMNVSVVVDRNDNWLPQKGKGDHGRIDGFMAELMAYVALSRHEDEYKGVI
jgi:phage terminase large subunit-like protein